MKPIDIVCNKIQSISKTKSTNSIELFENDEPNLSRVTNTLDINENSIKRSRTNLPDKDQTLQALRPPIAQKKVKTEEKSLFTE